MKRQDISSLRGDSRHFCIEHHDGIIYTGRLLDTTCLVVYKVYIQAGSNLTYRHYLHKDGQCPLLMEKDALVFFLGEFDGYLADKDYKALAGILERLCAALAVARLLPGEVWPASGNLVLLEAAKASILSLGLPEPAFTWAR